jgi:CRP-like cAMP-binding protein
MALSDQQKRDILRHVRLFASLGDGDLEAVAGVATTRNLTAREELFHKGDRGSQIYIVSSGRLKIITTSEEGSDLMFCVADPGEVIGEVGLLVDRPRTATVTAIQPSELIVIDRRDFERLLRSRPDFALELLTVLAERVARVSEFLEDTHFLNLPVRLAKKLCHFAGQDGKERQVDGRTEIFIDLKLSQEEWGELVGTTRESINKQFRAWTKDGLIALERGRVIIRDLDTLESLADCVVI